MELAELNHKKTNDHAVHFASIRTSNPSTITRKRRIISPKFLKVLEASAYFMWFLSLVLGIGMSAYIVEKFLRKPWQKWESVENFGESRHGAAFIGLHWVGGILVNILATLQLLPFIRRRAIWFHRWSGRLVILGSITTCIGGLLFTWVRGTVGGFPMSFSFTIYGILFLASAILTYYYARKRQFSQHRRWAIRTFSLAIGSALYRLYIMPLFVIAFGAKGEAGTDGWTHQKKIDYLTIAAWFFYFPNLLVAELVIWIVWGYENAIDVSNFMEDGRLIEGEKFL
ncbi:hypothetical protein G9A89_012596 [Geosiphon pyriformis]|nr:hypothetical protein G9A89_012596 [Geosiphon pyriformis]